MVGAASVMWEWCDGGSSECDVGVVSVMVGAE